MFPRTPAYGRIQIGQHQVERDDHDRKIDEQRQHEAEVLADDELTRVTGFDSRA